MLQRVRRCRFCHREMVGLPSAYAENPLCQVCLHQRMSAGTEAIGPVRRVKVGAYWEIIPEFQTRSSDDDLPRHR